MVKKTYVWLLEEVDYDYQHTIGVFSTRRKAFECKRKHKMIMKGAELVVLPYEMDKEYTIDWSEVGKVAPDAEKT